MKRSCQKKRKMEPASYPYILKENRPRRIALSRLSLLSIISIIFIVNTSINCSASNQNMNAEILDKAHLGEKAVGYPTTPEGVVAVFIETGLSTARPEEQYKYLPGKEDIEANRVTRVIDLSKEWGPYWGKIHVVNGYEITDVKKEDRRAEVHVLYKRIGWIWSRPVDISACRGSESGKDMEKKKSRGLVILETAKRISNKDEVWNADTCKIFRIKNDEEIVIYHLAMPGGKWRILNAYEQHVSISSAIQVLEGILSRANDPKRWTSPSEDQIRGIEKDIEILKRL